MEMTDFAGRVAKRMGFPKQDTFDTIEQTFHELAELMLAGEHLHVKNFCVFELRPVQRKLMQKINRKKGGGSIPMWVEARYVPRAKFSPWFRAEIRKIPLKEDDKRDIS